MAKRNTGDARWEKKLNISTGAAEHEKDDACHSRYEPTSYAVLERLAASGYIGRDNVLVDYGCGKGRVSIFMNRAVGCRSVGVEYDARLCDIANANLASFTGRRGGGVEFVCESAESYAVGDADCFYFFNPFSVTLLRGVISRILEAYYEAPRPMRLFFYYCLDSYLEYLMTDDMLAYEGEIDCRDIFHNDDAREKILVFAIDG